MRRRLTGTVFTICGKSRVGRAARTLCGQALEHLVCALEPDAFPAAQVAGHGRFLVEHLLRPLAGFGGASLGSQQFRVIQVGLRQRGGVDGLAKERLGLILISGQRTGLGQQTAGAMEIVIGILADHSLQVGYGRRGVA